MDCRTSAVQPVSMLVDPQLGLNRHEPPCFTSTTFFELAWEGSSCNCIITKSFAKTTLLCSVIVILQEEIGRWCDEAKEGTTWPITCVMEEYHCLYCNHVETSTETHYLQFGPTQLDTYYKNLEICYMHSTVEKMFWLVLVWNFLKKMVWETVACTILE